jgi:hypothetical protein
MPIFLITGTTTFGCQVILIPPLELSLGRQRYFPGFLATDQIPTHGDQSFATLRCGDDISGSRAPIEAGECRFLDFANAPENL